MFRTINLNGQEVRILDLTVKAVVWQIEHKIRGIFIGWVTRSQFDSRSPPGNIVPQFRYSIVRTAQTGWVTRSVKEAEEEILKVLPHAPEAYLVKTLR